AGRLLDSAAGLGSRLLVLRLGLALGLGLLGLGLLLGGLVLLLLGVLVGRRLSAVGRGFGLGGGRLLRRLFLLLASRPLRLRLRLVLGGLGLLLHGLVLAFLVRHHRILALSPPAWPRNSRVGANSPSLCPTIDSDTKTGTCLRPSCTAMVWPTISGKIVDMRDQVFTICLLPEEFMA